MFNAGAEWETALSMAAVASFAEAAMKAWDDLPIGFGRQIGQSISFGLALLKLGHRARKRRPARQQQSLNAPLPRC